MLAPEKKIIPNSISLQYLDHSRHLVFIALHDPPGDFVLQIVWPPCQYQFFSKVLLYFPATLTNLSISFA